MKNTKSTSALTRAAPIAQSLLRVDDKVVRRWDTAGARVQVVKPLLRDMPVAQILNPRHLLPCSFSSYGIFERRSRVLSDNQDSCA